MIKNKETEHNISKLLVFDLDKIRKSKNSELRIWIDHFATIFIYGNREGFLYLGNLLISMGLIEDCDDSFHIHVDDIDYDYDKSSIREVALCNPKYLNPKIRKRFFQEAKRNLSRCVLFGYSIRKKIVKPLSYNKPNTKIITLDSKLSKPHAILTTEPHDEIDEFRCYDVRYSLEVICELYNHLSEKEQQKYEIFAYAPERAAFLDNFYNYFWIKREIIREKHLETDISKLDMKLCGYDIIKMGSFWSSTLTNSKIDWKIAEKFGKLNENHLFNKYSEAKRFAKECSKFLKKQPKCEVWAIYKVDIDKLRYGL